MITLGDRFLTEADMVRPVFSVLASLSLAAFMTTGSVPMDARAESNIMIIVDASGSMKKAVDGEPRMTAAKRVLAETLANMPPDVRLGLMIYGHRRAKDCSDIELVAPIATEDNESLANRIRNLKARGETPIAQALERAAKSFAALKDDQNSIVLVTDGVEECGGDPCAAARAIRESGIGLRVDVVGFTLNAKQRELVQCVADETGGQYFDASDSEGLSNALQSVREKAADNSLISVKNGGQLLTAPNEMWIRTNDGDFKTYLNASEWMRVGQEAIYAFKDEQPATFDTFNVLVNEADGQNVKGIELFVGDDGPLGTFRSIGVVTTQNTKMMKSPFQQFKFEPVTARYLKVKILSNHGGDQYVMPSEFQVMGSLVEGGGQDGSASSTENRPNLLDPSQGGQLLAAPSDLWLKTNDGKLVTSPNGSSWLRTGEEAVYAFKDEKLATFDTFAVLVNEASGENVKDFELLAGDDGPTGNFRSIGTFTTLNARLTKSPLQEFRFEPVTARYLKVKLISNHGGDAYIMPSEFRLLAVGSPG
jgi:Mg-chelatase subunit ChlD